MPFTVPPFTVPPESPLGQEQPLSWRWLAPSWLISAVVHALLILALGYVAGQEIHGTNGPPFGELLASASTAPDENELFDDEGSVTLEAASEPALPDASDGIETSGGAMSDVIADEPPVDTSSALPAARELAGLGTGEEGPATGAGELTGGPRRTAKVSGGRARTSVYGIEGEGNRFVYVFDRSASMGSGSGSPLASAQRELLASLAELSETNQFQIIFYNEEPAAMNLGRQYGGLLFADRQSQELAQKYVRGIMAAGGTRHGEAIEAALSLAPDVIFFLTDADQPELSAGRLARIKRMNGGRASIHTIEFGLGAKSGRDNFLARIARQNGGKYVYIDISAQGALKLRAARD
ncbi:MAG TPA: hypothetical protein VMV10_09200 [Pirellulales bacterium]|nr:hypothetical protein [Pirellulales bacterium]